MEIKKTFKNRYFLALLILIVIGTSIRVYQIGAQSLWLDEGISAMAAKALLKNGWPRIGGHEIFKGILHTVFVAISFKAFGVSEAAGRIPSLLFGVLSIPLGFLIGKRMKNSRVGLLTAFLLTFSTIQIAWSRQLRFYQQLQFFFMLSLYLMDRLMEDTNWRNLSGLAIVTFCMIGSHGRLGFFLLLPLGIWFLVEKTSWIKYWIFNLKKSRIRGLTGVIILISIAIIFISLRMETIESGFSHLIHHERNYVFEYISHFEEELGYLFFLAIPGSLLAILYRRRNLFYISAFLLPFLVLSYRVYAYQTRHVFSLLPLLFILSAFSLDYVFKRVKTTLESVELQEIACLALASTLIILLAAYPSGNFTYTPKKYYDLGPTQPQANFKRAHNYIRKHWQENDILLTTMPPITLWYLPEENYRPFYYLSSFWNFPSVEPIGQTQILSFEKFHLLENKNSGWAVIDTMGAYRIYRGGKWITSRKVLNYIEENFERVEEASGPGVSVYNWT